MEGNEHVIAYELKSDKRTYVRREPPTDRLADARRLPGVGKDTTTGYDGTLKIWANTTGQKIQGC
jgi:hypothetical protein